MTIAEYSQRTIPEYYPRMYQDGFKPWEVMVAAQKKRQRELAARQEQKQL